MSKNVILMVDNSVEFLTTRAEYVRAAGFTVLTAATPDEARRLARRKHIDLAVIDLRLLNDDNPDDATGLFLAEELHPRMRVILNTGFPDVRTVLGALRRDDLGESAADNYISKADGPVALIAEIRRLCAAPASGSQIRNKRSWRNIRLVFGVLTIVGVIIGIILGLFMEKAYLICILILTGLQVIWAVVSLLWPKK
jgi:ActR/RegA family two-component response regulator